MKNVEASFFQFSWHVLEVGYWIEEGESGRLLLRPKSYRPQAARQYPPLNEETGLFKTFANTDPTPKGILGFANRYGTLEHLTPGFGEPLDQWVDQIRKVRHTVDIWTSAIDEDKRQLRKHIKWSDGDREISAKNHDGSKVVVVSDSRPEMLDRITPKDVIKPALLYVMDVVNKALKEGTSIRLMWNSAPQLFVCPSTLQAAIWLQLANAIGGDKEYRECGQCGKWFEIAPRVGSPTKQYCSTGCRQAAYRQRKEASK